MNIWDSVHRGLEKASQEAARIARTQRLRSTIDSLSRQIHMQNDTLLNRTMELFTAGQLTQSELLPICQELTTLKQQLEQAQLELKALQGQAPQPSSTATFSTPTSSISAVPYAGSEVAPTVYAPPPPGYPTPENTMPIPAPPPPPGMEPLTIGSQETLAMSAGTPTPAQTPAQKSHCPNCHAELVPGNAYCHNCGTLIEDLSASHLPTVRAGAPEQLSGQATIRSHTAPPISEQETIRAATPPPPPIESQETVRGEFPPSAPPPSTNQEGGQ